MKMTANIDVQIDSTRNRHALTNEGGSWSLPPSNINLYFCPRHPKNHITNVNKTTKAMSSVCQKLLSICQSIMHNFTEKHNPV